MSAQVAAGGPKIAPCQKFMNKFLDFIEILWNHFENNIFYCFLLLYIVKRLIAAYMYLGIVGIMSNVTSTRNRYAVKRTR